MVWRSMMPQECRKSWKKKDWGRS